MTNPAPNPTNARQPGDLPTWLTILIVLLCVGGGGALAWWYFVAPPKVVTVAIPAGAQRQGPQRPPRAQPVPDWNNDVRPANNGYNGRAGNVQLIARRRDNAGPFNLTVTYRMELIPGTQLILTRAPLMVNSEEQVKKLKLTPEQIEALRKVPRQRGMLMTPEDTQQLRVAFEAFEQAAGDQREEPKQKLLALLATLEPKNLEPTKAALAANVAAVRAILTPEQQQMIERNQVSM